MTVAKYFNIKLAGISENSQETITRVTWEVEGLSEDEKARVLNPFLMKSIDGGLTWIPVNRDPAYDPDKKDQVTFEILAEEAETDNAVGFRMYLDIAGQNRIEKFYFDGVPAVLLKAKEGKFVNVNKDRKDNLIKQVKIRNIYTNDKKSFLFFEVDRCENQDLVMFHYRENRDGEVPGNNEITYKELPFHWSLSGEFKDLETVLYKMEWPKEFDINNCVFFCTADTFNAKNDDFLITPFSFERDLYTAEIVGVYVYHADDLTVADSEIKYFQREPRNHYEDHIFYGHEGDNLSFLQGFSFHGRQQPYRFGEQIYDASVTFYEGEKPQFYANSGRGGNAAGGEAWGNYTPDRIKLDVMIRDGDKRRITERIYMFDDFFKYPKIIID